MKINLCSKADFKTNNMLEVTHSGHSYLIAKVNDDFFVVDNMCSHENSELILGCLKDISIKCSLHGSYFDLRTGEPLNESIVRHGPFVTNSEREMKQVMLDYHNGKMGELI